MELVERPRAKARLRMGRPWWEAHREELRALPPNEFVEKYGSSLSTIRRWRRLLDADPVVERRERERAWWESHETELVSLGCREFSRRHEVGVGSAWKWARTLRAKADRIKSA